MGASPAKEMPHIIRNAAVASLRRSAVARRTMSTVMSEEENVRMQKLYPHMRTNWMGNVGAESNSSSAWEATKKKWIIVEVYPLYAAIGGGCLICFAHLMRHLFFSPDVFLSKSNRNNAMIENFKEGSSWKGNPFRSLGNLKSNKTDPFR